MGLRQSRPPTPAEYARHELSKPVDDDALSPRSSAPVRPVIDASSSVEEVPPSNTAPPELPRLLSRRLSRRNSGLRSGGNVEVNYAFAIGDRVEARWRGLSEWYPGEITAHVEGYCYSITYDC